MLLKRTIGCGFLILALACCAYAICQFANGTTRFLRMSAVGAYVFFGFFLLMSVRFLVAEKQLDNTLKDPPDELSNS